MPDGKELITTHFVDVRFTPVELSVLCDLVSDKTDFYRQLETKLNRNYNDLMRLLVKEKCVYHL